MAIDRPDWSGGLPVPNGAGVPSTFDGHSLPATDADYAGLGPQAQSTLQTGTGLHHELVREMHGTPDGFAANLESLKENATRLLDEFPQSEALVAHFDTLSPSIQSKVFRGLWQNPGISFLDLLDKVEPTMTLAEAHEAEAWLHKLRRGL